MNTAEHSRPQYLRPIIPVELGQKEIKTLLDPGSDLNLISLRHLNNPIISENRIMLRLAAQGQQVQTLGMTRVQFAIKQGQFEMNFHVVEDLGHDMILGMPWFVEQKVVLDFYRSCMNYGERERNTIFWKTKTLNSLRNVRLPEVKDERFGKLLREFVEVFQIGMQQPTTQTTTHRIHLKRDIIINKKCYPMAPAKKRILYELIDEMLQAGVLEPSISPFASPPVLVNRPGKSPRFCVDYRELNKITMDESSGLPRIF